ncbi:Imm52 family immunity protein [Streptomyces sp. NPDC002536]
MADLFYVGAYWGPRTESAGECAERLADCLSRLGAVHPVLATWFRKGRNKSAASGNSVEIGSDALEKLLAGGRNRTDVGGHVISDLGFRAALWNKNSVPVAFSTTCGASPATSSVMNHFALELPEPSGLAAELYDPEIAGAVFRSVVGAWDPDWATFASYSMRAAQAAAPGSPVGGWMTYLSGAQELLAVEDREVRIEGFSRGTLLVAGADPLSVSDSQLSAVRQYFPAA